MVDDRRSDEALLAAALAEQDAFAVFYVRHERLVLGFFGRRVRDPETAADLTAETFAAALEVVGRFDPLRGSAIGWLLGIAHNVLLASWRKGRVESGARERLRMQPVRLDDGHLEAISRLIAEEQIDELDRLERDAVLHRVLDDHSYAEVATILNCSEQVVRQRVSRGLKCLRRFAQKEET